MRLMLATYDSHPRMVTIDWPAKLLTRFDFRVV
jgi:hypothetical protein